MVSDRFELSSAGQASPSISQKPVETINHKVVTRHAEKHSSPYPKGFNLGGEYSLLFTSQISLPACLTEFYFFSNSEDEEVSSTPDLIGSHVVPPCKLNEDSCSINESTSSGETATDMDRHGGTLKVRSLSPPSNTSFNPFLKYYFEC